MSHRRVEFLQTERPLRIYALSLPKSAVRYSATFIWPVQVLRDPIRLDRIGEHRWWAKSLDEKKHNPIRLVRMVEKIESTIRSLQFLWGMKFIDRVSHLIHHPCKTDGVLRIAEAKSR